MRFDELPLHDATLTSITHKWESKEVCVLGKYYSKELACVASFRLTFSLVQLLHVSHTEDWGPSSQINKMHRVRTDEFAIEMQSGDVITIRASRFDFATATHNKQNQADG